jgi:hypothetical protein
MNTGAAVCPHCETPPRSGRARWAVLLGLAGSASLGLTMMACYGAPPCEPGKPGCIDRDAATDTSAKGTGVEGGSTPAP